MKTIKTIALLLVIYLAQYPLNLPAQTCIEYKESGITIRANAIDRINNSIRYDVVAPIDKIDIVQDLLNITMTCKDRVCKYSNVVSVPNLTEIYKGNLILLTDVGKDLEVAEQQFGANIILFYGLLKLDNNWSIKQK